MDRYDIFNYRGHHHICGLSIAVFEDSELGNIVTSITTEISTWTTKDTFHGIAILVASQFLIKKLSQLMTMEKIPFCDVGQQNQ